MSQTTTTHQMSDFQSAAEKVKSFQGLSNDELLQLYGLFKQANEGDVSTSRPGIFDPKGKAKWDAWKACEGKSKEDAAAAYVALVNKLGEKQ
mmetsp:Transcript_2734/g.10505  ORF Transcript_2734/g.10505 Transcript_2734/m.10505 type:complete len:92 (+) Transcript_2734:3-278(+)